jgi:hypothetical protein
MSIIYCDELIELNLFDILKLIIDEPRMINNIFIKDKLNSIIKIYNKKLILNNTSRIPFMVV